MTSAPANLLAVRRLLLDHLDIDPSRARSIDLESAEVGIVGDPAHIGGYHCGSDRVRRVDGEIRDYSVIESSRDRAGLTLDAAALDVGMFTVTTPKGTYDLAHFSAWCVAQCAAGASDARDIREIIWSPDGRTVRRWDALGRRTTGDDSHRWHTHFSFFRDAIKAGRDLTSLFRRYLIHIGLLEAPTTTEDDMTPSERWVFHVMNYRLEGIRANRPVIKVPPRADLVKAGLGSDHVAATGYEEPNLLAVAVGADETDEQAIATYLAKLLPANTAVTDEQLARVLRQVFGSLDAAPAS